VCTENFIRIAWLRESLNVGAVLPRFHFNVAILAEVVPVVNSMQLARGAVSDHAAIKTMQQQGHSKIAKYK
jgi:hypothetical protein